MINIIWDKIFLYLQHCFLKQIPLAFKLPLFYAVSTRFIPVAQSSPGNVNN